MNIIDTTYLSEEYKVARTLIPFLIEIKRDSPQIYELIIKLVEAA